MGVVILGLFAFPLRSTRFGTGDRINNDTTKSISEVPHQMVFFTQVKAAIVALRERDGSAGQQIQSFLEQKYEMKFDMDAQRRLRAILSNSFDGHLPHSARVKGGKKPPRSQRWKWKKWEVRPPLTQRLDPVQNLNTTTKEFDELMYGDMLKNKKCSEEQLDKIVFHYFNTKKPIEYPEELPFKSTFRRDDHFHAIIAPFGTKFLLDKYGAGVCAQMMVKVYDVDNSNARWAANFEMIGQLVQGYQEVASMYKAHCDYKPGGSGAKSAANDFQAKQKGF